MRGLGVLLVVMTAVSVGCGGWESNYSANETTLPEAKDAPATVKEVAAVFESTTGVFGPPSEDRSYGCMKESETSREDLLDRFAGPNGMDSPGTKDYVEWQRSSSVLSAALEKLSEGTIVTEHYCFGPGSFVYSVDKSGASEVLLVYVCCDPSDSIVADLRATGAMIDVDPIPDDGSGSDPA